MKQLLIMRHAKSDWSSVSGSDFDRPLNKRGRKDVPRIAEYLQQQDITPDRILSSPAERAKETTELLIAGFGLSGDVIQWQPKLYLAGASILIEMIRDGLEQANHSLLIVSHNPGLDEIVNYLASEPPPRSSTGKLMTTSAVAVFNHVDEIQPTHLKLERLIRPNEI